MAELQTKKTTASVDAFLKKIPSDQMREDCLRIVQIMEKATKSKPRMWGPSIIGFGDHTYRYPNGREMEWMQVAFSPRKQAITLYICAEFAEFDDLLAQLGKHSRSKACIYVKRLSDISVPTLKKMITASVACLKKRS